MWPRHCLIGAWYGHSRLLILVGIVAVAGHRRRHGHRPGAHGESVYTPRAADVKDRNTVPESSSSTSRRSPTSTLAGRTIEVDANVGQVIILVPTSIDATIDAEVTGGDIEDCRRRGVRPWGGQGGPRWNDRGPGRRDRRSCGSVRSVGTGSAGTTPIDVPAPGQQIIEPTGASDVTAACN